MKTFPEILDYVSNVKEFTEKFKNTNNILLNK